MSNAVPDALISAAERLFAERGSDAVSLREINAAAGSTNASAIQYHFGGRRGLMRAVLDKHEVHIERRRHAMLDAYEAGGAPGPRALSAALVEPLAAELGTDGGPGYLQLIADLYNQPDPKFDLDAMEDRMSSYVRWRALALPLLSPEAVRLHRRFDALRFAASELARRARTGRRDHRLFTSQLTDLVTALLGAPVSDETRRLLRC
ncbi:helix-turn-helix domain-containing protein [Actinocorallia populi]|uniref:helix-turn-helix domain-containing protein n=1 Tax=Actinocorallia populi TaxID=2079200 RepID=UPI000D08A84B|nr:TetR/AcrR family transcriptional regulator [Actinocorallia populi]